MALRVSIIVPTIDTEDTFTDCPERHDDIIYLGKKTKVCRTGGNRSRVKICSFRRR
jgi:hypothetical protein